MSDDEDNGIETFFPNLIHGYLKYREENKKPKKTKKQQAEEELERLKDENEALKLKKQIDQAKKEREDLIKGV